MKPSLTTCPAALMKYEVSDNGKNGRHKRVALFFSVRVGKGTTGLRAMTWSGPLESRRTVTVCNRVGVKGDAEAIATRRATVMPCSVLVEIDQSTGVPTIVGVPRVVGPKELVTIGAPKARPQPETETATGFRVGGKIESPSVVPLRGSLVARAALVLMSSVIAPAYKTRRGAINAALVACGRDIERAETRARRLRIRRDALLRMRDGKV